MKVKHIVYTILIVGIGAFIAYRITENKGEKNESKEKDGKKKPANVTGMVLKPQVFADNLSLSGSIEANEQIEIRSEVSGVVESINFSEGATVSKGQVLFKVNDIELRAQLAKAKTAQALASENERRAKLLLQKEAMEQHVHAQEALPRQGDAIGRKLGEVAVVPDRGPGAGEPLADVDAELHAEVPGMDSALLQLKNRFPNQPFVG